MAVGQGRDCILGQNDLENRGDITKGTETETSKAYKTSFTLRHERGGGPR